MSIFDKVIQAGEAYLDNIIEKSQGEVETKKSEDRKGLLQVDFSSATQPEGYKERRGLVGPEMLKSMGRKDSIVSSIIQTRKSQMSNFARPQKDKYSPGFIFRPNETADPSEEEQTALQNPELTNGDDEGEALEKLKFEMEQAKAKKLQEQKDDIDELNGFVMNCGMLDPEGIPSEEMTFGKFISLVVEDRYIYNHVALELIKTKDQERLHSFRPVSAGGIRLVSKRSAEEYTKKIMENINKYVDAEMSEVTPHKLPPAPFKYVQKVRGKIVAAWTDEELLFESPNPSVDPEDQGYGYGELDMLIQIITSHLYAEAHNRNFFTQGIASKGILHIKGDNISRAQLEGFKRQWLNQMTNSRNAFRPPIIGMADDVKWVALTQSNREMEYENWMNYLIKVTCAIFQIDPSEINFDISKEGSSTLNESNNERRIKSSRDKGLKPLLGFIQDIMNNRILPLWNPKLAKKYTFEFVGLDAESREQEIERFQKEVQTWKTINEIRSEMGKGAIEGGEVILNGAYTQYLQMKQEGALGGEGMEEEVPPPEDGGLAGSDMEDLFDMDDSESLMNELTSALDAHEQEKEAAAKEESTKKSNYIDENGKELTVEEVLGMGPVDYYDAEGNKLSKDAK